MRTRRLVRGDPTSLVFSMFCSPEVDQGARGILATICAYSFSVCRIQISQVCITRLCGPMSQSCIPAFSLQFICITFCECKQIMFIFYQYRYSSIQLQLIFLAYYLLSFVAHLVLFTIPGLSWGSTKCGA